MQKLVEGLQKFASNVYPKQRDLFAKLAKGQSPEVLFITCSDSRVGPQHITQTDPGDIFVIRNAGNIVPPYGTHTSGEAATIDYALTALNIEHIVICGHTGCGAMTALLDVEKIPHASPVRRWLDNAEGTRRLMLDAYADVEGPDRLKACIQENVLVQVEHLRTHPSVQSALARGSLSIYAWVYDIEHGRILQYDPEAQKYLPLEEARPAVRLPSRAAGQAIAAGGAG